MIISIYCGLLFLYPADYRARFGKEMAEVFRQAYAEACTQGYFSRFRFCLRELTGVVRAASCEQANTYGRSWWAAHMRRMVMSRRLHSITVILAMSLVLLAVVVTIETLKTFALQMSVSRPMLSPRFPLAVWEMLAVAYGGGAVGWAIAFAIRRTGMHRLADMETRSGKNETVSPD